MAFWWNLLSVNHFDLHLHHLDFKLFQMGLAYPGMGLVGSVCTYLAASQDVGIAASPKISRLDYIARPYFDLIVFLSIC